MRLPDKGSKDQTLKPMDTSKAWLAPLMGDEAVPAAAFQGRSQGSRLAAQRSRGEGVDGIRQNRRRQRHHSAAGSLQRESLAQGAKGEEGAEIVWTAEADFESGIGGFIVLRDGQELAKLPKTPVGKFGRPLFQSMTYHDTPAQPLPEMRYFDAPRPNPAPSTPTKSSR